MPNSQIDKVVQHVRSTVLLGECAELTDGQLLECFLNRREQAAVEALVRRHGGMVWGVCQRVLRSQHDAEDAFQATFLVLLRKATAIVPREMVGNWLYGVARQTALNARSMRTKRRAREKQMTDMLEPAAPEQQLWNDLQPILDEEMSRLPDKYRAVLVLCELEGKTGRQAAQQLGVPEGTVASRVARARALLAKRMARHGLAVSGGTFAAMLSEAAACAPVAVVSSTIKTVTLVAAGNAFSSCAIPTKVAAITEGVLKAMLLNKLKTVTAVCAVLGACVVAAGIGAFAAQLLVAAHRPEAKQSQPRVAEAGPTKPPEMNQNAVDRYGDPLPPGALARLGTVRLRHSGTVNVVAFSPAGTTLISGDEIGEMRLWDAATGKLLRTFVDPLHHRVGALAFSPDGKWFVSGIARLSLWNVADGTRLDFAADHSFGVNSVASLAFSPDGKSLAVTAERDPLIRFYSVPAGKLLSQLDEGHAWTSNASAYSPDGKLLATAGVDKLVRVWDLATRKTRHQFKLPDMALDVTWTADGKRLAAATMKTAFVWDVATETQVHEFDQGDRDLYLSFKHSLAFSPDGKRLASSDRIWDLSSGKVVCRCAGRLSGGLSYAPDGKAVATAGDDGAVRLHDPDTGKELPHLYGVGGSGEFLRLGFAPDGRRLVALRGVVRPGACEPGSARLQSWTSDGREARELVIDGCGRSAAISPNGAVFVVAGDGGAVTVWDTVSGQRVRQLIGDDGKDKRGPGAPWIKATFAFSPDSRFVASAGRGEKDIRVWEVRTGKLVQTMNGRGEGINFLTFSGNGQRLVSAGFHDNGLARFWDLATGKEWRPAMALSGSVRAVSADGQTWALAVEVRDRITDPLRICAVETGKEILRLEKGGRCAFAPDGRTIAVQVDPPPSTEEDDHVSESTIQVIELATGGVRTQFRGHRAKLETLVYSADAKLLASGSSDNTALLWDLMGQGDRRQGKLSAKELQALWETLGSDKAETAHVAMCILDRATEQTVAFVRTHLPPKVDTERVSLLIKNLDHDDYTVRDEAEAGLQRFADLAAPALRQALKEKPNAEVRRRLARLVEQLDQGRTPEQLRSLRAIELLERNGSLEARRVLEELAKGMLETQQTQEAKASLDRLARRQ